MSTGERRAVDARTGASPVARRTRSRSGAEASGRRPPAGLGRASRGAGARPGGEGLTVRGGAQGFQTPWLDHRDRGAPRTPAGGGRRRTRLRQAKATSSRTADADATAGPAALAPRLIEYLHPTRADSTVLAQPCAFDRTSLGDQSERSRLSTLRAGGIQNECDRRRSRLPR